MKPDKAEQFTQGESFRGRILLLADDGRMARMLSEQLSDCPLDR